MSFWLSVDPSSNVTAAGGGMILGDSGGKFSATLSGANTFRMQWSSNDGRGNGVSSCTVALSTGVGHHLASTWQSGSQQYFVDGVPTQPDTKAGTLGVLGDVATHAFGVGSGQAGAVVTVDEPTFWSGYALTAQDAMALRGRSSRPQDIAPASIALRWSLAGPAGVAARVGDAGLADGSANGLALGSIVGAAPSYAAGDLTYVPLPAIGGASASPSGKSIVLAFQDDAGNPSGLASVLSANEVQQVTLTAVPAGSAFALSFGGKAIAPLPVTVLPPTTFGLWTFPVTPGHSYDLAESFRGSNAARYLREVIDGGAVVASSMTTATGPAGATTGFADSGASAAVGNGGVPLQWNAIATGIVPTGATLSIRCTGSHDPGYLEADALRVKDTTASTIAYYDDATNFTPSPGSSPAYPDPGFYHGQAVHYVTGIGNRPLLSGGAAALQAAIQGLPGMAPGAIAVADLSGSGPGVYQVTFAGTLADTSQPLMTCADPAVSITRVSAGGVAPLLTVTPQGGTARPPVPLYDFVYSPNQPYSAYGMLLLPQSAPDSKTTGIGGEGYSEAGYWKRSPDPARYSGLDYYNNDAGATITVSDAVLPPGSYRFAVTYGTAPGNFYGTLYHQAPAVQFQIKDGSGKVLEAVAVDQTQAPADYQTADGFGWKYVGGIHATDKYNNGLSLVMTTAGLSGTSAAFLDAVQILRASPDTSLILRPTDAATLSIPSGWAATASAPVPAIAALAVAPPSATAIMPAFVAAPKTARVGYNVEPSSNYNTFPVFSNLATRLDNNDPGVAQQDANGYPTKIRLGQSGRDGNGRVVLNLIMALRPATPGGNGKGLDCLPNGLYSMFWDGDPTLMLGAYGTSSVTVTERADLQSLGGTTGHIRVFELRAYPGVAYSPGLSLEVHGSAADPADPTGNTDLVSISNLRIYPPDPADPTGETPWYKAGGVVPPKFHPTFLYKLQGASCLRFLDPLGANNNTWANLSHLKTNTHINRTDPQTALNLAVVTVKEPAGNRFFAPCDRVVQVTTAAPHGLFDLAWVTLHNCGTAAFSDGSNQGLDIAYGVVKVVDAVNLLFLANSGNGPQVAMSNTLKPAGGTLTASVGTPWPLQDVVDLAAATGAPRIWVPVTSSADATPGGGVDQVFAFLAAHLPAGVKVYVEHGNECWNFNTPQYACNRAMNARITGVDDGSYQVYYTNQCQVLHLRAQAMFAAAGRPDDIIFTYAGTSDWVDFTTPLIAPQAKANGARMDAYATANYFENADGQSGAAAALEPIYDRMTVDQLLDFMELNAERGRFEVGPLTAHKPYLVANGFGSAEQVFYEAAPDVMIPGLFPSGPPGPTLNYYRRQEAVKRHPRMYGIMLRILQRAQDHGLTLWNHFNVGGDAGPFAWGAFEGWNQQRGTGDPALDPINVSDPQAMDRVSSEVAGALHYWSTLAPQAGTGSGTGTGTGTTKNRLVPGRNGQVRSIGLPRGMFRPTR